MAVWCVTALMQSFMLLKCIAGSVKVGHVFEKPANDYEGKALFKCSLRLHFHFEFFVLFVWALFGPDLMVFKAITLKFGLWLFFPLFNFLFLFHSFLLLFLNFFFHSFPFPPPLIVLVFFFSSSSNRSDRLITENKIVQSSFLCNSSLENHNLLLHQLVSSILPLLVRNQWH